MNTKSEIARLQDNLQTIRKVAGWTTEELGERIGVTKQTISNLENKKTEMTKTQYIALRTILDYEIVTNTESVALARVVDVLLNIEEPEEEISEEKITTQKKAITKESSKVLAAAATAAAVATLNPVLLGVTTNWLMRIMKDKK